MSTGFLVLAQALYLGNGIEAYGSATFAEPSAGGGENESPLCPPVTPNFFAFAVGCPSKLIPDLLFEFACTAQEASNTALLPLMSNAPLSAPLSPSTHIGVVEEVAAEFTVIA